MTTWELSFTNTPDNFLNGFTRLSGLTVPRSGYFFKVSSTPDFDNGVPVAFGPKTTLRNLQARSAH